MACWWGNTVCCFVWVNYSWAPCWKCLELLSELSLSCCAGRDLPTLVARLPFHGQALFHLLPFSPCHTPRPSWLWLCSLALSKLKKKKRKKRQILGALQRCNQKWHLTKQALTLACGECKTHPLAGFFLQPHYVTQNKPLAVFQTCLSFKRRCLHPPSDNPQLSGSLFLISKALPLQCLLLEIHFSS